tara:strand:+ start:174 stop:791 length:618 start_codon:yes stop_codon:yes gene_type:complete
MVYKNFLLRLLFSFMFIIIYLSISFINFSIVFYLILIIYLVILIEIHYNFLNYKKIPIIYVLISFIFFNFIELNDSQFLNFNLFIFIVITFDIFSYVSGKCFGHNKLTKISPNKTIEGFIGGFLICIILSLGFANFFKIEITFELILLIIVIIISAFIGDLTESFFKRKNNLKNSSELIPGHGGVFDRFDSFLFSIILYSLLTNI